MTHPLIIATAVNGPAERVRIMAGEMVAKVRGVWVPYEKILAAWNGNESTPVDGGGK